MPLMNLAPIGTLTDSHVVSGVDFERDESRDGNLTSRCQIFSHRIDADFIITRFPAGKTLRIQFLSNSKL